jgi:hypothetical protein
MSASVPVSPVFGSVHETELAPKRGIPPMKRRCNDLYSRHLLLRNLKVRANLAGQAIYVNGMIISLAQWRLQETVLPKRGLPPEPARRIIEVLTGFVESLALCIGAGQFLYEAT